MAEKKHEQSGFKVTDRRLFTPDGELRPEVAEQDEAPKVEAPKAATPTAIPAEATMPTPQATEMGDTPDNEMPIPPTSAEQEAQAAAYKQSSKDLDSQVELSGHS